MHKRVVQRPGVPNLLKSVTLLCSRHRSPVGIKHGVQSTGTPSDQARRESRTDRSLPGFRGFLNTSQPQPLSVYIQQQDTMAFGKRNHSGLLPAFFAVVLPIASIIGGEMTVAHAAAAPSQDTLSIIRDAGLLCQSAYNMGQGRALDLPPGYQLIQQFSQAPPRLLIVGADPSATEPGKFNKVVTAWEGLSVWNNVTEDLVTGLTNPATVFDSNGIPLFYAHSGTVASYTQASQLGIRQAAANACATGCTVEHVGHSFGGMIAGVAALAQCSDTATQDAISAACARPNGMEVINLGGPAPLAFPPAVTSDNTAAPTFMSEAATTALANINAIKVCNYGDDLCAANGIIAPVASTNSTTPTSTRRASSREAIDARRDTEVSATAPATTNATFSFNATEYVDKVCLCSTLRSSPHTTKPRITPRRRMSQPTALTLTLRVWLLMTPAMLWRMTLAHTTQGRENTPARSNQL